MVSGRLVYSPGSGWRCLRIVGQKSEVQDLLLPSFRQSLYLVLLSFPHLRFLGKQILPCFYDRMSPSLTKLAFTGAALFMASASASKAATAGFYTSDLFPRDPKSCSSPQLSCQNTTVQNDLCCFNAPGGQMLLTQFWDTDPVTGPVDSWTVHGLW